MPYSNPIIPNYIVYGLIDPNTDLIRYIGKTVTGIQRIYDHWTPSSINESPTNHKNRWLQKLKTANNKYKFDILFVANSELTKNEANIILYKVEQDLIKSYKSTLTNDVDGGPGVTGRKVSKETRLKMSNSAKNRPLPLALIENQRPKNLPKKILKQKSRVIPGAKEKYANSMKMLIKITDPNTQKTKKILGLRDAAKLIGGKCNKTGIRLAIKNKTEYYGFYWGLI